MQKHKKKHEPSLRARRSQNNIMRVPSDKSKTNYLRMKESHHEYQGTPFVSIWCITFNHQDYISEAIDSFLMQKTNFPFNIVIGDDCSSDNTVSIIEAYQIKYPGKITLLKSNKNYGFMTNFIRTFKACNGVYIALCEGDDFWVDDQKLQKQIDYLEMHPELSACFHNVKVIDEDGKLMKFFHDNWLPQIFDFEQACRGWFIHMNSICLNKETNALSSLEYFADLNTISGDRLLVALLADKGKIGYLNETMSTYRRHNTSITGKSDHMRFLNSNILVLSRLMKFFNGKKSKVIKEQLFRTNGQKAILLFNRKEYWNYMIQLVKTARLISTLNEFKAFIKIFLLQINE